LVEWDEKNVLATFPVIKILTTSNIAEREFDQQFLKTLAVY